MWPFKRIRDKDYSHREREVLREALEWASAIPVKELKLHIEANEAAVSNRKRPADLFAYSVAGIGDIEARAWYDTKERDSDIRVCVTLSGLTLASQMALKSCDNLIPTVKKETES